MNTTVNIGDRFGRLVVFSLDESSTTKAVRFICICDCGVKKSIRKSKLYTGNTSSCGCLRRELISKKNMSHGQTGTSLYYAWKTMKSRCTNKNFHKYESYGARGIKICEKWMTFEGFIEDMGERPKGMTIDRIDVNGDYCKDNCRWATPSQQARNKTNTRYINAFGKTQCLADWADETGVDHRTISSRLSRGWSPERSLTP